MNKTHPLVGAYLERLDRLLVGAPSETRAEVMAGSSALTLHPIELLALLFVPPAWPVVAILVGISRLWLPSEKVALTAALPALAVWLLLLSPLPNALRTVGGLLGVLIAAWVVVRAGRRGLARAR